MIDLARPVLVLDSVHKTFRTVKNQYVQAIREIGLHVGKGEFVSIIGPSGCGKTTLLRMIAGLEKPSGGEIYLEGHVSHGVNPQIGFVFQEFVLLPWRTVVENVEFGLELWKENKRLRRKRAEEFVKVMELEGFENKYPKELSGGMKQRVSIARAMICEPKILLMDEPFAALDAQTRFNMQKFLLKIWKETGQTIVFVTHNIDEAVYLGNRLIVMSSRPGKIVSETKIDLDYPRDVNSQDFIEIRKDASEILQNSDNY